MLRRLCYEADKGIENITIKHLCFFFRWLGGIRDSLLTYRALWVSHIMHNEYSDFRTSLDSLWNCRKSCQSFPIAPAIVPRKKKIRRVPLRCLFEPRRLHLRETEWWTVEVHRPGTRRDVHHVQLEIRPTANKKTLLIAMFNLLAFNSV